MIKYNHGGDNLGLGENIKQLRKNKGLTQKELGELIGVKAITIRKYESNEREPNFETLYKIADVLEVSINDLLGIEGKVKHIIGNVEDLEKIEQMDEDNQKELSYICETKDIPKLICWICWRNQFLNSKLASKGIEVEFDHLLKNPSETIDKENVFTSEMVLLSQGLYKLFEIYLNNFSANNSKNISNKDFIAFQNMTNDVLNALSKYFNEENK